MIKKIFSRIKSITKIIILKLLHFNNFKFNCKIHRIYLSSMDCIDIAGGNITLKGPTKIYKNSKIGARNGGNIIIGKYCSMNNNFICISHGSIVIGDNTIIGPNVCIYDHDHDFDSDGKKNSEFRVGKVEIGNNVWIGAGAIILRNTIIGDNCIIGAGTVVKGNIPANSIVTNERKLIIRKLENRSKSE